MSAIEYFEKLHDTYPKYGKHGLKIIRD